MEWLTRFQLNSLVSVINTLTVNRLNDLKRSNLHDLEVEHRVRFVDDFVIIEQFLRKYNSRKKGLVKHWKLKTEHLTMQPKLHFNKNKFIIEQMEEIEECQ